MPFNNHSNIATKYRNRKCIGGIVEIMAPGETFLNNEGGYTMNCRDDGAW
jgi:hypothetical protein